MQDSLEKKSGKGQVIKYFISKERLEKERLN
jgi:hypothetical protein